MRIAVVASLVSPIRPAEANGPHSVIVDLARGLGARRHEVTVYAARGSTADGVTFREVDVDPIVQSAAIRTDGSPAPAAAQAALEHGFQRVFDAVADDGPDVVSQHAFDAPAIRLAERLAVIHTLHLPPIIDAVVAAARETGRQLATVSHAARVTWMRAGAPESIVLRNGVPDPGWRTATVRDVALIAGRISPEKGTHTAIGVARRAGLRPLVVGDVYDAGYYEAAVQPLLEDGEFVGPVARIRLFELMSESAVLLMPIEWDEPFGLVAAEAQMTGCPVVGYRRGALPEVVWDGYTGFLAAPGDEAELEAGVIRSGRLDRGRIRSWAQLHLGVDRMIGDYEGALYAVAHGRRWAA